MLSTVILRKVLTAWWKSRAARTAPAAAAAARGAERAGLWAAKAAVQMGA
jgi:hypothetical protein